MKIVSLNLQVDDEDAPWLADFLNKMARGDTSELLEEMLQRQGITLHDHGTLIKDATHQLWSKTTFVYFRRNSRFEDALGVFPTDYVKVAEVICDLDGVFELCNNIPTAWKDNSQVTYKVTKKVEDCICVEDCRSMNIGDAVMFKGKLYLCASTEWTEIKPDTYWVNGPGGGIELQGFSKDDAVLTYIESAIEMHEDISEGDIKLEEVHAELME